MTVVFVIYSMRFVDGQSVTKGQKIPFAFHILKEKYEKQSAIAQTGHVRYREGVKGLPCEVGTATLSFSSSTFITILPLTLQNFSHINQFDTVKNKKDILK